LGAILVGSIVALLLFPKRSHFVPSRRTVFPKSPASLYSAVRAYFEQRVFAPVRNWNVEVSGTTGTPIVVGYELDRSRTGTFRGVVPTSFTVRGRRCLYCAVKNVGNTTAQFGFMVLDAQGGGGRQPGPLYPPLYGFSFQTDRYAGGGVRGGDATLSPPDWPETLPPGMTRQEAARHDFTKELHEARVREYEAMVAKAPSDVWALWGLAQEHRAFTNYAAVEAAYAKLFVADCDDATFLNMTIYDYVEKGGTNLNRAYEAALRAQTLALQDPANRSYVAPFITDTVGWILIKQGYYERGLAVLQPLNRLPELQATVGVTFHRAMAHYMLMEEDRAQKELQEVIQAPVYLFEKGQAKQCLEVLGIKEHTPRSKLVAKLKARLAEAPDDPVALSRLADMYEQTDKLPNDALVTKALGFMAYRHGEYPRAVQYLTESAKNRSGDGELFFHLGMACHRLGIQSEAAQWMRKALSLNLKDATIEEAKRVLGEPTPTNAPVRVSPQP
jgi:tetratricopeptide (TPR) repeat protein